MPSSGSCRICAHTQAEAINGELLSLGMNRRSLRGVALLFHLSPETLRRHFRICLGQSVPQPIGDKPQVMQQTQPRSTRFSTDLVTRAVELNNRAQVCGNPNLMLSITRELAQLIADLLQEAENK